MKIVEDTDDRLVIEDRPVLLAGATWTMSAAALLAVMLGGLGSVGEMLLVTALGFGGCTLAWWAFPFQRITFSRSAGHVSRRIARVTGATTINLPLAEIRSAAAQGNWSDGTRMERLVFLTDRGPVPLEYGFGSAPRDDIVRRINDWLKSGS